MITNRRPLAVWPKIEHLINSHYLNYIDFAFAELLLRNYPDAGEAPAAFLCYLSLNARKGHICASIDDSSLHPSPEELAPTSENGSIILNLSEFSQLVRLGAHQIPQELITNIDGHLITNPPATPLCRQRNLYYFQRHWILKSQFLHHYERIKNSFPIIIPDLAQCKSHLNQLLDQKALQSEQVNGITQALTHCLTIISGGPGTGKTYTAGHLVKTILANIESDKRENFEIVLAAPTGKAAYQLQSSINSVIQSKCCSQAKTLHALLGITHQGHIDHKRSSQISADLVLVDESSMIDLRLMAKLLASLKTGARLVLLGDQEQLPPVDSGGLFSDLIQLEGDAVCYLKTSLRTELKTILDFASQINLGNPDIVLNSLNQATIDRGLARVHLDNSSLQNAILSIAYPQFPNITQNHDPKMLLEAFQTFRILSPLRNGVLGIDTLNTLFLDKAWKNHKKGTAFIAPILISKNDYRNQLFNGEMGLLVTFGNEKIGIMTEGDYALFPDPNQPSGYKQIPAIFITHFEYAYCLSVHKSQGSEFDHIFILLPEGSEQFGKEMLYTAVTRAKKSVQIWGSDPVLRGTITKNSKRFSAIT